MMEKALREKMRPGISHIRFDKKEGAFWSLLGKIRSVIFMVLALYVSGAAFAEATATDTSQGKEQDAILDAVAQINHINWVVNTIKTYKNPIVLEIESQKVSPGNLYLDRIPDRAAMERIKQILNTLHDLRMDEREMKRWREDFEERRDREQKTFLLKVSKQAVDTMTKQVQECCSQWSWESNPVGSIAAVVNTAFNIVHCPVSLYNDYDNFVYAQNKSAKDKQFDFDTAKLNLLHQQNIGLLEDQWNFITRYKLDDKLRVSDADINMLLNCLRDDNPSRIYTRLAPMSERFSLFPAYWYYLSCAAMETGHFKEGLVACDQFFKVNRHIFRDDPMEGIVAFNKAFMLPKTDANKEAVRRSLELASRNNVLRGDWQLDYLVAIVYKGVFDERGKAEELLERAIATNEQESRKRMRSGVRICITLEEGLLNCRNALHQLRGEPLEQVKPQQKKKGIEFKAAKTGDTKTITLPGGDTMEMIYVAPGSFMMGNDNGTLDEKPVHRVTITKGFWLGKYEVTQAQWKSVMGSVEIERGWSWWPSSPAFSGEDRPMDIVSWYDCQDFIKKVNAKLGDGVARLPTEAEWEYACRAGTTGDYGGIGKLSEMGWHHGDLFGIRAFGNSGDATHNVGEKRANHWGFYDMHGNVYEWCNDWYGYYPYGDCTDPVGPSSGKDHVRRGGSWDSGARCCTSSYRTAGPPILVSEVKDCGFRLCCSAESQ